MVEKNTESVKTRTLDRVIRESEQFEFIAFVKKYKKKVLLIIFASLLFAFGTTSLLTRAATIPTGVSAISLTISFIFTELKPFLNFVSLALNIPLFLIFWKKIKKSYIHLTFIFLICSAVFGFLIAFEWTGESHSSLDYILEQNLLIFLPPTNSEEAKFVGLWNEKYNLDGAFALKNIANVKLNDFNNVLSEGSGTTQTQIDSRTGITLGVVKGWPIFIYSLSGVFLSATGGAIAWKCGGSTGGTDIVAYYFSTKQKKSIGTILTMIGAAISSISLLIVWSLSQFAPIKISSNINGFKSLIGLQTLSSIIYVILYGRILNAIYPKYTKVLVKIDTSNVEIIKEYFTKSNFHHAYKIYKFTSGRTGKDVYSIETVVLLLEVEELIRNIKKIDPTSWVSRTKVEKIYGAFDYSKVE